MVRDGHFEKVMYKSKGKVEECYRLTKLGRETANHLWCLERQYHAQSPTHDLAVADKYFSIPLELRESWKSESQVRHDFEQRLFAMREEGKEVLAKQYEEMLNRGLISMPDAVYTDENGKEVAFEIITNSYGIQELQAKEACIEIMNYQYEVKRV